ncbi:MAG: histone deacetylase [candidate division WOR-3 bacterium]|nr:histone deacetylase [candidate division WOR-3 bacterium]MCX7756921.1 histone deacetylase [candidate division WOR-3 bacterium]MDW7987651.1 histone deacetylase [candidate division WOR-3 bacterium]
MKFVYSDKYEVNLGTHVFPTEKYRLIKERLIKEQLARAEDFITPEPAAVEDIKLVHTPAYVEDMLNLRWTARTVRSELPLTQEIITSAFIHAQGTILASLEALKSRCAIHLGGGFHHAFADHAEGFCYVNDVAVAIRKLQKLNLIKRAAIIDCDLHQGNGTARIFQNDSTVFTFSIHQEHLYPIKEESDWDIGLDDYTSDSEYLSLLSDAVAKIIPDHKPDIVIYLAGADPYQLDQLGSLRLTKEGLMKRDQIVLENCYNYSVPVAITLAGGYAYDLNDTVEIHFNTCKVAIQIFS